MPKLTREEYEALDARWWALEYRLDDCIDSCESDLLIQEQREIEQIQSKSQFHIDENGEIVENPYGT